jgi:hypothetical protein
MLQVDQSAFPVARGAPGIAKLDEVTPLLVLVEAVTTAVEPKKVENVTRLPFTLFADPLIAMLVPEAPEVGEDDNTPPVRESKAVAFDGR